MDKGLGGRLLKEVRGSAVGLVDLLSEIRSATSFRSLEAHANRGIVRPILNVPSIDRLLQKPLYDLANRQAELIRDEKVYNEYGGIDTESVPAPTLTPIILEVSSDRTCAGKTQLLYYLTAVSILPETWRGVYINGKNGSVVVIDCDGRFGGINNVQRLRDVVSGYIRRRVLAHINAYGEININEAHIAELVTSCLDHVHIFRPESSAGLLDTIRYIPTFILNVSKHTSGDRHLDCVLIDDISAFYHTDKLSSLLASEEEETTETEKFSFIQTYDAITNSIRDVSKLLGANVVITNTKMKSSSSDSKFPTHLPNAYTYGSFLTARIVLSRDKVAQFHDGISLKEAWDERDMRWDVLQKSGISGWVESAIRTTGGGGGGAGKDEGDWFWFWLGEDEVVMDKPEEEDE